MKKIFSVTMVLGTLSINCVSQNEYYDPTRVIAQPYLNIREKPDVNSKILTHADFGEEIMVRSDEQVQDTVNGIAGAWAQAVYKGVKGYAWLHYTGGNFAPDTTYNITFRIMYENEYCSDINYSPKLNWYGLYATDDSTVQELIKVEITLIFRNTVTEKEAAKYFDPEGGADYFVKTNLNKKSVVLIGSQKPLKEGKMNGILFKRFDYKDKNPPNFLYPEQIKNLAVGNISPLTLRAKTEAHIQDTASLTITQHYQLEVALNEEEYYQYNDFEGQDISDDIPHMKNPPNLHAVYRNPTLLWYGDIDGDNKVDFIICSLMMQDTCGADNNTLLFVSSEAGKGELVKKVAHCVNYGCY